MTTAKNPLSSLGAQNAWAQIIGQIEAYVCLSHQSQHIQDVARVETNHQRATGILHIKDFLSIPKFRILGHQSQGMVFKFEAYPVGASL